MSRGAAAPTSREPRCERTELPVSMCAHCRKLPDPVDEVVELRRRLVAKGDWIIAQYRGTCTACGEDYPAGTAIHRRWGDRQWRAECCATENEAR